jgi:hypothetical protein
MVRRLRGQDEMSAGTASVADTITFSLSRHSFLLMASTQPCWHENISVMQNLGAQEMASLAMRGRSTSFD